MKELTRKKYIILLLTIVLFMTIGFAVLSSTLTINGTSTINSNTWNVKFQNIVLDSSNNVTATTPPSISDNTSISFSVALSKPGDKYSFTVDVVNTGSIDAMINTITKSSIPSAQQDLIEYYVTYSDYISINQKDKLVKTNGSETIRFSLYYKLDLEASDLPSSAVNLNLSFSLNYVQADSTANIVDHTATLDSFIVKAKTGNATSTDVGTTFTIDLGDTYGTHTLRVANVSSPSECFNAGFSQTACGVVLEFADIITTHNMNPSGTYKGTQYDYGWNVDGWPATSMRTFVNTDIYNAIPSPLKSAIIETSVVSGHGYTSGETNFVTTDKLYLLNLKEVYNSTSTYDTSNSYSRQLDYYAGQNATTSSYSDAIKQYDGEDCWWWLRSADSGNHYDFLFVYYGGDWNSDRADGSAGVSPAFRIA